MRHDVKKVRHEGKWADIMLHRWRHLLMTLWASYIVHCGSIQSSRPTIWLHDFSTRKHFLENHFFLKIHIGINMKLNLIFNVFSQRPRIIDTFHPSVTFGYFPFLRSDILYSSLRIFWNVNHVSFILTFNGKIFINLSTHKKIFL